MRHHFCTSYCPWTNGTMQRMCKEAIRAARSLLLEWRLNGNERLSVFHYIQSVIGQTMHKRLKMRMKTMTGDALQKHLRA